MAATEERSSVEAYVGTAVPLIILDGLLGVGARPPLREPVRDKATNEPARTGHVFGLYGNEDGSIDRRRADCHWRHKRYVGQT